jgi:hypothetical protein
MIYTFFGSIRRERHVAARATALLNKPEPDQLVAWLTATILALFRGKVHRICRYLDGLLVQM